MAVVKAYEPFASDQPGLLIATTPRRPMMPEEPTGTIDTDSSADQAVPTETEEDEIIVSDDKMLASVKIGAFERDPEGHLQEIITLLFAEGITGGVEEEAIRSAIVERMETHKPCEAVIAARGRPPVRGSDGYVEWLVKPPGSSCTGTYVETDTPVLRLVEPGEGTAGVDVFGDEVPATSGKRTEILPGDWLELEGNDGTWTAKSDGRVCVCKNKVHISPVKMFEGNLEPQPGGHHVSQCVEVRGDILDGVELVAARSVCVTGDIHKATVKCEGDLGVIGTVNRGATLFAGGSVNGGALKGAEIETWGDVTSEAVQDCKISARGAIDCSNGEVAGGHIECSRLTARRIAGGTVVVSPAGARSGCKSHDHDGFKFKVNPALRGMDAKIKRLKKSRNELEARVNAILGHGNDERGKKSIETAERGRAMLPDIIRRTKHLEVKRRRAAEQPLEREYKTVSVSDMVEAGVEFKSNGCNWKTAAALSGPIEI